jgi:DNA-binding IclR family transcriptional regulator
MSYLRRHYGGSAYTIQSMNIDRDSIRARALSLIAEDGHRVGGRLARAVGMSRQVANGYLQALLQDGLVEAEGTTRARVYRLKALACETRSLPREGLGEDVVWRAVVAPLVADLSENVRNIWHYGATDSRLNRTTFATAMRPAVRT